MVWTKHSLIRPRESSEHGLDTVPWLYLTGDQPLQNAQHVNRVVMAIKDHIGKAQTRTGTHQMDLFIAGPAQLALFWGNG